MSHHEPGFQQVQVQVPRPRPPATDQVLGVGTAWEPQPVWCYQQHNQCNIAKAMIIVFLGCAVASREKTKYRCRPMTTKLHFTCNQFPSGHIVIILLA